MWQKLKADFKEQIWDHEQVLKIRQKFSELDTQSQSYILIGSFGAFVLILLLSFFGLLGRTISIKKEIATLEEQIKFVQLSAVKIEELRTQTQQQSFEPLLEGIDPSAPVGSFLERATQKALISKTNVEITSEGSKGELKLSRISLTQLARVLYIIEKSKSGTSVERYSVDAKDDLEGYLWAEFTVKKMEGK